MYIGTSGIDFEVLEGDEVRECLLGLAERFRAAVGERPS
jgi:hypothetical protein